MQPDRVLTRPFALTVLAEFATCMSIGMLLVILPVYANDELGAGSFAVALVIGAVSPMILLSQPLAGRIGDRKGRRILVVAGALIAGVSVAAYSFAGSLELLIAFRLFTGLGEAMLLVGAATIVTDLAPEHRRGEALSLYSLGLWGGLALGPILGEAVLGDGRFTEVWLLAAGFCFLSAA
ncbi:MAG TPA: MFS transporter, partial [Gaiellaceae bacterium]|nr:MFS transporter [Gaiellaceae bacterium]